MGNPFSCVEDSQPVGIEMRKIVRLRQDMKPRKFENKSTIPLKHVISDYIKASERYFPEDQRHVKNMSPTYGSEDMVHTCQDGRGLDMGFFSTIMECYNNHWALRTVPDDWWCTVIRTVAIAINDNSKNENVSKLFLDHVGKERLSVDVDDCKIDFDKFFNDMTNLVQANAKIDGFVDTIRSDFSTSTSTHKLVSTIMIMTSLQEYFEYENMPISNKGIPYIELAGAEADWTNLKTKLLNLKKLLKPIEKEIQLQGWWEEALSVFEKLLESFKGDADADWWNSILHITYYSCSDFDEKSYIRYSYESGKYETGRSNAYYDGWFITKILNNKHGLLDLNEMPSGLASIPLTIKENGRKSDAAFVCGIAGMKIDDSKDIPLVEAVHGWTMLE